MSPLLSAAEQPQSSCCQKWEAVVALFILFIPAQPPSQISCDPECVTFLFILFIPALPPSQVICDPACVTFLFHGSRLVFHGYSPKYTRPNCILAQRSILGPPPGGR